MHHRLARSCSASVAFVALLTLTARSTLPPPSGAGWSDEFGPGTRIPAVIISPFAKRGYVDKTVYDTTSIQKFLNARFGLEPLPGLREKMGDLTNTFQF